MFIEINNCFGRHSFDFHLSFLVQPGTFYLKRRDDLNFSKYSIIQSIKNIVSRLAEVL